MNSYGYAGKILSVDLSSGRTRQVPTSDYAAKFLGGKGIALRMYWDEVPPQAGALDPENALIFSTGPLAGVPIIGGTRLYVTAKSPMTSPEHLTYCNMGGDWAPRLKSAGYDAVFLQGRAGKPVYLLIEEDSCQVKDASWLWGKGAVQARELLQGQLGDSISVVAIGQAGENMVSMAVLIGSDDASGGGGMGAVMGSKNLKAVVVRGDRKRAQVAQPERLDSLTKEFRRIFTPAPDIKVANLPIKITGPNTAKAPCWLCMGDCLRRTYQARDGRKGKLMCQSGTFYQAWSDAYYGQGSEAHFHANRTCDEYGVETMAMTVIIVWLMSCARQGILTDESAGVPISKAGSLEFIETLVRKISLREGLGDLLARGVEHAADHLGAKARELLFPVVCKAGLPNVLEGRLYLNTALMAAMEPKPPLGQTHEVKKLIIRWLDWRKGVEGSYVSPDVFRRVAARLWGSEEAGDFTNIDAMPLATKLIQDRQYAQDCLLLCDFFWPVMDSQFTPDHVGDPSLEGKILSAVTGKETDEAGLSVVGERVFNLNRAILIREGHRGIEDDGCPEAWCTLPLRLDMTNPEMVVPGKGDEVVCLKGRTVDREEFATIRRNYYRLRQWNEETGMQTAAKLREVGLGDIADELKSKGLAH